MNRDGPEDDAARTASPSHPGPCVKGARENPHRQVNSSAAHVWRDGFAHGFHDALRIAGRRLPPEARHLIDALADAYALAGGDG